jgi:hypothetical protein
MDPFNLTPEMKKRAREAETSEDILVLTHEMGHALSDEELDSVSGGYDSSDDDPCGSDCYYYCEIIN